MDEEYKLIERAKKGDVNSFQLLITRYDRQVYSLALSFIRCEDEAKDIYQDVMIRVYKGLKKFEYRSSFSTWLFRITTNVCLTYTKKKKKKNILYDTEENLEDIKEYSSDNADSIIRNEEIRKEIESALNKLAPKEKLAFTMKYMNGLKICEIADLMNCKDGTIKRYLFTASKKMKNSLVKFYKEEN